MLEQWIFDEAAETGEVPEDDQELPIAMEWCGDFSGQRMLVGDWTPDTFGWPVCDGPDDDDGHHKGKRAADSVPRAQGLTKR